MSPNGAEAKLQPERKQTDLPSAGEVVVSLAPPLLRRESCVRQGLVAALHESAIGAKRT